MADLVYGTKASAVKRTFLIDGDIKELHTAWFPRIEVNGAMVYIADNTTKTGKVEFDTRYKAIKFAREFLARKRGENHG